MVCRITVRRAREVVPAPPRAVRLLLSRDPMRFLVSATLGCRVVLVRMFVKNALGWGAVVFPYVNVICQSHVFMAFGTPRTVIVLRCMTEFKTDTCIVAAASS